MPFDNIELFPMTAGINAADHLTLGGCDVADLAAEFGTPLLVYDEDTLRSMCRQFLDGFTSRYSNTMVAYASKAFLNTAIAKLMVEEGMGMMHRGLDSNRRMLGDKHPETLKSERHLEALLVEKSERDDE